MIHTGETITVLSECLRSELSAVETYDFAVRIMKHSPATSTLRQIRDSHDRRVAMLRDRIRRGGTEVPASGGAWDSLGRVLQPGADILSDRVALATLQEGEQRLVTTYTSEIERCDPDTQSFLRSQIMPEQERTHDLCQSLCHAAAARDRAQRP